MRLSHFAFALTAAALAWSAPALSAAPEEPAVPVAIQEKLIENKTGDRKANFRPLIDLVKVGLFEAGYDVVDEADMGTALEQVDKADLLDGGPGKTNLVMPGYFIRISVVKYGWLELSDRNRLLDRHERTAAANVKLVFTIVDARTARLIAAVDAESREHARTIVTMSRQNKNADNFGEQALQDASAECVQMLCAELNRNVPAPFRPKPAVVRSLKANDEIVLRVPRRRMREGAVYDVFRLESFDDEEDDEDEEADPADMDEVFVGQVQAVRVLERNTVCRSLTPGAKFEAGMIARPARRIAPPQQQDPGLLPPPPNPEAGAPF